MSERGSFVTEYIGCEKCLAAIASRLLGNDKYLKGVRIPSWVPPVEMPIIAGKIGGMYGGEEAHVMEALLDEKPWPDHRVRVVVLTDSGATVLLVVGPEGVEEPIELGRRGLGNP